ncbi:YdeI/OmpD-associated family protein [Aminobacter sp. AP02]|uniref:YdeI/OmpD-associated family protein n=1 Tax=Aminobacter sp. AP02 TaxID=2135737 RepID=UPI000D6BABDE|nr:YdeI/OmpD-associated family protein [Aminobacter sp. AP02]PWK70702.1 bacteriocin resistance YdeI/OmpD-like protein [Aminobacter sp. AP02]
MALTRDIIPMPDWIRSELLSRGMLTAYEARPEYQRNDYLGWITRAKLEATRRKRLDELERGGVYMRMVWRGLSPLADAAASIWPAAWPSDRAKSPATMDGA